MDKKKAIGYLKERLSEIPYLVTLRYDNDDYPLWRSTIAGVLEEVFGPDSSEYQRFITSGQQSRAPGIDVGKRVQREDYSANLKSLETVILSIIQNHETSNVEKRPTEKHPFEKGWEIELQGDNLSRLHPLITMVANELRFQNCYFEARLASSKATDDYNWFDVFITDLTTRGTKIPIGAFTLQLLGNNRIMLRVPPRSRWHHDGGLTGEEMIRMGLTEKDKEESSFAHECFSQFMRSLEDRFTRYGLKLTSRKRLWRGFKEIIGIWNKIKP